MTAKKSFPYIAPLGVTGALVCFGDDPAGPANAAAIAFRAAVEALGWAEIEETTTSLVSTGVFFDPLGLEFDDLVARLQELLDSRDWMDMPLQSRRLWRVPVAFDDANGPDLEEAATHAGLTTTQAIKEICATPVHVLTLGFAPGQPYLGMMPPHWDIPRRSDISPKVPRGALVVAVRQAIIFTNETPTGWWHVGQTGFANFRPGHTEPFALSAGDQVAFHAVSGGDLDRLIAEDPRGMGGATCEALPC